jgi:hypothetical protein
MNKEQQELIDEAFLNYGQKMISADLWMLVDTGWPSTQEEFINMCKTDDKWGLKIEERELSLEERNEWFQIHRNGNNPLMKSDWKDFELDQQNIPAKLITVTYKDKTITSYGN